MRSLAIAFAGMFCAAAVAVAADAPPEKNDGSAAALLVGGDANVAPQQVKDHPEPGVKARGEARGRKVALPKGRVCFNASDTREKIIAHRLTEPFRALKAGRLQGEALRARLCRWNKDQFVYEISVLRRDGRVVHVYMNASNGKNVDAKNVDAMSDASRK